MRMSLVDGCIVLSENLKDAREKRNQKTQRNFLINFLLSVTFFNGTIYGSPETQKMEK